MAGDIRPGSDGHAAPALAGVNGLRALAAGAVLIYHVWRFGGQADLGALDRAMPHLWHGVTLFFVLSGFLLYRPFAAATLRRTATPSLRRFARNRALRVLPAYWVILLFTVFVLGTALVPDGSAPRTEGAPPAELLVLDLLFLQNYSEGTIFTGIGPAWSLSVEVVFYVVLPLLALVALAVARRFGHRLAAALAPATLLVVVGASGTVASLAFVEWNLGVVRSFWGMAHLLALGMLVAVAAVELEDGRLRAPRHWRATAGAAIVLVVVVAVVAEPTNLDPGAPATLGFNLAAGLACALLVALVTVGETTSRPGRAVRVLEWRPLALAGLVSYSAFLWHEPLLRRLDMWNLTLDGPGGFVVNVLLTVALTGVASALTWRFVEEPALRLKAPAHDGGPAGRRVAAPSSPTRGMGRRAGVMASLLVVVVLVGCGGGGEPSAQRAPAPEERRAAGERDGRDGGGAGRSGAASQRARYAFARLPGVTTAASFTSLGDEGLKRWARDVPAIQDVRVGAGEQSALHLPARRGDGDRPLLVVLHSWSNEYRQHIGIPYARWAQRHNWAMIAPNFNGANVTADATGSDEAVQDVVDAIDFAIERGGVDRERVFVVGFSGGGMMSLLMAGRHPDRIAGAVAWVPVHDLVGWHRYNAGQAPRRDYANHIETACGGDPGADRVARASCERRSPRSWLHAARRARVPVYIGHGLADDLVRPSAALRAFNQLADPADRLGRGSVATVDGNALPASVTGSNGVPTYFRAGDPDVLFAARSAAATVVLFEGEHDMVYHPGLEWMTRVASQPSGAAARPSRTESAGGDR